MTSQFLDLTTSSIFWRCFVSLVNFSYYWFKSHVNIIAGSEVMTIFFYMGLTRNPEIGNTPVSVLPNIWRLGRVMNTTFGTHVSNTVLQNAAKFQGYSFYRFWVIKGKPTGAVKLLPPPRLGLRDSCRNSLLLLSKLTWINYLLIYLKLWEKLGFPNYFRGNRKAKAATTDWGKACYKLGHVLLNAAKYYILEHTVPSTVQDVNFYRISNWNFTVKV